MSTITALNTTFYYQRIQQAFGLSSVAEEDKLLQGLSSQEDEDLCKAVAYLADHSSKKLEEAVKKKLDSADSETVKRMVTNLIGHSFKNERLRMLDVCQRIVSLPQLKKMANVDDVMRLAQAKAYITPLPGKASGVSDPLLKRLYLHTGVFAKLIQYFITTVTWSYGIDLDSPPKNRWIAQSQMTFFRSLLDDFKWVFTPIFQFFTTTWKTALVAGSIFSSIVGLNYLYRRYVRGVPAILDKKLSRHLTAEARAGLLRVTLARKEEREKVERCLTVPPGGQPSIPILVGEPGIGKTQLMEGLACNIARGDSPLKGKEVYMINTSSLMEWGGYSEAGNYSSRLDMLLEEIRGYEDRIIFFLDEAQNANPLSIDVLHSGAGSLLEPLKTKLLERKILCVLATTTKEYTKHLARNTAFVDRITKIDLLPLSTEETKRVLQQRIGLDYEGAVGVTPEALDKILHVTQTHYLYKSRANPRKSEGILQEAINYVYGWTPQTLKEEVAKQEAAYYDYIAVCQAKEQKAPGWILTQEGEAAVLEIKRLAEMLKETQTAREKELAQIEKVKRLQKIEPAYLKRGYEMIHFLAKQEASKVSEEAQKSYLFLDYVVLPQLRQFIEEEARNFKDKMPLRVDGNLIDRLYFPIQTVDPNPSDNSKAKKIKSSSAANLHRLSYIPSTPSIDSTALEETHNFPSRRKRVESSKSTPNIHPFAPSPSSSSDYHDSELRSPPNIPFQDTSTMGYENSVSPPADMEEVKLTWKR